ncbi:hypothetical protein EYF80_009319 [Liparis tanakae]|uniref:Uncharacterized protein n=1 Tax=Liparis tanakae TaxID=230148 RepID=A0A4Z2IQU9_9TELE|nr:hypothetical protein EYF80_009319 [Liparis tanakae]
MNGQFHSSASAFPSADDTSRSPSRSTLFPTRIIGTLSYRFTRMIWSLIGLMSWKLCWFTRL